MFEKIYADMFNKVIKEDIDYFKEERYVPLGMREPIEKYMRNREEFENSDDLVGFHIDDKNIFAGAMISPSGMGKGRFSKNIVKALWKAGWKILVVDAKAHEFLAARKVGQGRRIHPKDKNEKLPVVGYVPSYVEREIPEHLKNEFKVYSHNIKQLKTREMWASLGMSSKSADWCVSQIDDGVDDIEVMEQRLMMDESLLPITKRAGLSAMALLTGTRFFNASRRELDIKKHWDNDEIISLSYFSKAGNLMSTDIGMIIQQVKNIGVEELKKGPEFVTKKLIVLDDALYYLNSSDTKSGEINLAIVETLNIMNNYRSFGLNVLLQVQSTGLIDFKIVESCNHFFIGKIKRPSSMLDIVPRDLYQVLNSSGAVNEPPPLVNDQIRFVREWIYLTGDDWQRFFVFDCTVGH